MSLIEKYELTIKDVQQSESSVRGLGADIEDLKRERESLKHSIDSIRQQIEQSELRQKELEQALSQRKQKLEEAKRQLPSHQKAALNEIESILAEVEEVEKLRQEFEQRFTAVLERLSSANQDASAVLGNRFVQNYPSNHFYDPKKMAQIPHLIVDRNGRQVTVKFI
jgi:chromosome segregation ATPase